MKKTNKLISILISIMMVISMLPSVVMAEEIRPEGLEWDEQTGTAYFAPMEFVEVYIVELWLDGECIDKNTVEGDWEEDFSVSDTLSYSFARTIEETGDGKYSFYVQACNETYEEFEAMDWDIDQLTAKGYKSFESTGFSYSHPSTAYETPMVTSFVNNTVKIIDPNTPTTSNAFEAYQQEAQVILNIYVDYGHTTPQWISENGFIPAEDNSYDLTGPMEWCSEVMDNLYAINPNEYDKNTAVIKVSATICSENICEIASSDESEMLEYGSASMGDNTGSTTPDTNTPSNSGTCGDDARWTLSDDDVLTISGTGTVDTMATDGQYPFDYQSVKKIVIEEGITRLGDDIFWEYIALTEISLPSTLQMIGTGFVKGSAVENVIIPEGVTYMNMHWAFNKCGSLNTVTFLNDDIQLEVPENAWLNTDYTIRASYGSNAHTYARENNIAFEALPSEDAAVKINVIDSQTLEPISGASIALYDSVFSSSASSDASGVATLAAENGLWQLTANAVGYPTRSISIEITDEAREFTVYMSKNSILNVSVSEPKEMTKEEIIKAGIDVNAVENKHVYNCVTVLQFTRDLSVSIPYICADNELIKGEPVKVNIPVDEKGTYNVATIYPVEKDVFLIIHSTTSWLKEMFDIQLLVANSSAVETIEDCVASLNLPDGLSLAAMTSNAQSADAELGDIAPNASIDHHWYVCGDVAGEYILDGIVTGTRVGGGIQEEISARFTTSEPITVLAGDAMKMTITAERTATVGETYRVKYSLKNVSDKTLYDVLFRLLRGEFIEAYDVREIVCKPEIFGEEAFEGDIENGFELSAPEFKPDEEISGIFEIKFGEGLDLTEGDAYILKEMFVFTGDGSTTIIPTEVEFVDSLVEHRFGDGVVKENAACGVEGVIEYACADCDEVKTEVIPALEHIFGDWYIAEPSTCIAEGVMVRACTQDGCEHFEEKITSYASHTWNGGEVTTAPTLESTGVMTYTCTVDGCDASYEEEIPELILQELAFATGDMTITYGDTKTVYNAANNDSPNGGELTYESSNTDVATVDNAGKVTVLKAGEATITATAAEKGIYGVTTASYRLIVNKAPLTIKVDDSWTYYAQEAKPFAFTATGLVNGETAEVLSGEPQYVTDYQMGGTAGEYDVAVSGLANDNYEITFASGKLTVRKAIDYKLVLSYLTYKADEEISGAAAALEPQDDTAQIAVEYQLADGEWTSEIPTTAGDYPIRAYLTASDNIAVSGKTDDVTDTFVIKPVASVTINSSGSISSTIVDNNIEFSMTDEAVEDIAENIPSTGEVIIDATGTSEGINNITLPSNIVQAVSEADDARAFTVSGDDAEIRMEKSVVSNVASRMDEGDKLEMRIEALENDDNLTPEQQATLDAVAAEAVVLELEMKVIAPDGSEKESIHELGGNVSVKAKFIPPTDMRSKKIVVCYVSDDGSRTYIRARYSDGFVYFTTDHYSVYLVDVEACTHEWNTGTVIEPATTSQTGLKHFVCTVCGDTKDDVIPKIVTSSGGGGTASEYTVTFETNGADKMSAVKVKRNEKLTKPLDPTKDGYVFVGWYSDKGLTKAYDFDTEVTKAFKLYAKWEKAEEKPEESAIEFTDVKPTDWYYEAVKFVAEKGITDGVTDTTFAPQDKVTRAQFITMLCRAYGIAEMTGDNFSDAGTDMWYTGYLAAAKQLGISNGVGDNMFAPEKEISREEMVTLLYNYFKSIGEITDAAADTTFADNSSVSDWAKAAVAYSSEKGYVTGRDNNIFDPQGDATRAELAQIFFNIFSAE